MNVGFRFLDGFNDWGWVCEHVHVLRVEDTTGIVAVNSDTGELIGVCIMDNWTANGVQCHLAITNLAAIRHGFITKITDYVFTQKDKKVMYGLVPSNNVKALKLDLHFGFVEKIRLHDTFGEGLDNIILELKRENCPYWIEPAAALENTDG